MAELSYRKYEAPSGEFWLWFLQRVTGLLLIALVLLHGWFNHFAQIDAFEAGLQDEPVVFSVVADRLTRVGFIALDLALLTLVLFHGLNGVRTVLLEWRPAARRRRAVTRSLIGIGVAAWVVTFIALVVLIL
ncbi:MAG: hypothetical protein QF554_13330 [Dehalococcoidia bacterium]|jgi:succinate dehydrogenase/fumarate reductase cytochrome b subunit|nr:hypothetical protein [Dehalococcoidia bacterium]